jgi:hypothetical protein
MNIAFAKSIDSAPREYLRLRLTEEERGTKLIVREADIDWLELGVGNPEEMDEEGFAGLCRSIIQATRESSHAKVATQFDLTPKLFKNLQHLTPERVSEIVGENYEIANAEPGAVTVTDVLACGRSYPSLEEAVRHGQEVGRARNA